MRRLNTLEWRAAAALAAFALSMAGLALRDARLNEYREIPQHHKASERLSLASMLASSLVPTSAIVRNDAQCQELQKVLTAWDKKIPFEWGIDPSRLLADGNDCRQRARDIGRLLVSDAARIRFADTRVASINQLDFVTRNPWQAIAGCIRIGPVVTAHRQPCMTPSLNDPWLESQLLPHAIALTRNPIGNVAYQGKKVPQGAHVTITFDSALQAMAQDIALCFTALGTCDGQLTPSMKEDKRFREDVPRTGMLGLVLLDVLTGRVLAMGGAISACTQRNLELPASTEKKPSNPKNVWPAFRENTSDACPQIPDRRFNWLKETHPALWPTSPGSTMKPVAVLAGLNARAIGAYEDARWREILARSEDKVSLQRLALGHDRAFLTLMDALDFNYPADLIHGGRVLSRSTQWPMPLVATGSLRPARISHGTAATIRSDKESGINTDARYGKTTMLEYLAARRLMDTAIGGGDSQMTGALGLADLFRRIELRANGLDQGPATHMIEADGTQTSAVALGFASSADAVRLTHMLTGVTASRLRGTASGACRLIFGACPADGLADLWGKTGTADATYEKDSPRPFLKPGVLPTKLFGAVFTDNTGRRLAIAAIALRSRDTDGRRLELHANPAAEAALLMIRHLRHPHPFTSDRSMDHEE